MSKHFSRVPLPPAAIFLVHFLVAGCRSPSATADSGASGSRGSEGSDEATASSEPEPPSAGTAGEDFPGDCTENLEAPVPKIWHDAWVRRFPDRGHDVRIRLRRLERVNVVCPDGSPAEPGSCEARDAALRRRRAIHEARLGCVVDALFANGRAQLYFTSFEVPEHLSDGDLVLVGTVFRTNASAADIDRIAASAFVEAVEPGWFVAAEAGIAPPPIDPGCPTSSDDAVGKIDGLERPKAGDRMGVGIGLKVEGILPPDLECSPADSSCAQRSDLRIFERVALNRTQYSCVLGAIEHLVDPASVPLLLYGFVSYDGQLPPPYSRNFRQVTTVFGHWMSYDEARQLAMHPYVAYVGTNPGLSPVDYNECDPVDPAVPDPPVPPAPACGPEREPADEKLDDVARMVLAEEDPPFEGLVLVKGGATGCMLPPCPSGNSCPERERLFNRWQQVNEASQTCVRELLLDLGGTAGLSFWIVNSFEAAFPSAEAVQALAQHPHVLSITLNSAMNPPPP